MIVSLILSLRRDIDAGKTIRGGTSWSSSSRVERATSDDLAELAALRVEQGWYGSEALLWAISTWEHGRHFILRASAVGPDAALDPTTVVAATSAIAAGPVGVIGNVITRPGLRGRGLGRAVLSATLAWLREQGARSVLLDATSDGQPLYQKFGFVARTVPGSLMPRSRASILPRCKRALEPTIRACALWMICR